MAASASLLERTDRSGLDVASSVLLQAAFVLSVLHIADHVLRVDHSGWPFRSEITPFTFSLLAFPMLLFVLFGQQRLYWWRWAVLFLATVATLFAHIVIETPHMQYAMWAQDRSADPHQQGFHDIPDIASPALGIASTIVAMALNVVAVTSTIAMLAHGLRMRAAAHGKELER